MSILITGVEMPEADDRVTIRIYDDGSCSEPKWQGCCKYLKGCKAVPVPPHGRLIDADALIKALATDDSEEQDGATLLMAVFLDVLKAAPTVIPADKGAGE